MSVCRTCGGAGYICDFCGMATDYELQRDGKDYCEPCYDDHLNKLHDDYMKGIKYG